MKKNILYFMGCNMAKNIYSNRTRKMTSNIYKKVDSDRELKKEISRVFSMANKRITRIDDSKHKSQAINILKQRGVEKFSSRGKSISELRTLYSYAMNFINNPTSTLSGIEEYNRYFAKKNNVDESLVDSITDMQNDVYDYVFFISRAEWYEIQNGYRSTQEILSGKGLTENVSDFITSFEKESNENRTILLKKMVSDDIQTRVKM